MPVFKDYTLYSYDSARDGQIAVGTVTSPWCHLDGASELLVQMTFTGGTTTVTIEFSVDGSNVAVSTAALTATIDAPQKVTAAYPWARVKIVQATAGTSNARLAVKTSD